MAVLSILHTIALVLGIRIAAASPSLRLPTDPTAVRVAAPRGGGAAQR